MGPVATVQSMWCFELDWQLQSERQKMEDAAASQGEVITELKYDLHSRENDLNEALELLKTSKTEIEDLVQKKQLLEGQKAG